MEKHTMLYIKWKVIVKPKDTEVYGGGGKESTLNLLYDSSTNNHRYNGKPVWRGQGSRDLTAVSGGGGGWAGKGSRLRLDTCTRNASDHCGSSLVFILEYLHISNVPKSK